MKKKDLENKKKSIVEITIEEHLSKVIKIEVPTNLKNEIDREIYPIKHLTENGTLKPHENIDYVFRKAQRQLELAGIKNAIPGIKRKSL